MHVCLYIFFLQDAGLKYWKRIDDEVIPDDCHYCKPPSASVEMTSYALLAYLLSEDKNIAESMAIVSWMNKQRSALGGYSTTQVGAGIDFKKGD